MDDSKHNQKVKPLLEVRKVHKSYFSAAETKVLHGVSLEIHKGEFVAITGSSGSGKSTLMHLIGLLDHPTKGEIYLNGNRIDNLKGSASDQLRNEEIGYIFQFYHLLPELTALENVTVPSLIRQPFWKYWSKKKSIQNDAKEILERVGLGHRMTHRPNQLSGGEMQRTAIARSLIEKPTLLLADEPTGNLDTKTGLSVIELLQTIRKESDLTILMVTHDQKVAAMADRRIQIVDGKIVESSRSTPVMEDQWNEPLAKVG